MPEEIDTRTCRFIRDVRCALPSIVAAYRAQQLFAEAKLRAVKALSFAKVIRKSIEVAAQIDLKCSLRAIFDVLSWLLYVMYAHAHIMQ
jgi:hypothetical protein